VLLVFFTLKSQFFSCKNTTEVELTIVGN